MGYFSLAFASAFLYAFWALGLGVYRGRLSNWLIILISAAGGTATYAIVGTLTGELTFDPGDVMPGLLGGLLNVCATYLLLMAYQRGKVAIASGVVATYVIVPLGYSVYSGQPFTGLVIVGVLLMLAGLATFYLVSIRERKEGETSKGTTTAILFALGAALCWGVSTVVIDTGTRVSLTGTMLVSMVPQIVVTGILVMVTARGQIKQLTPRASALLIATGICLAAANIAFYTAANEGNLGITAVISSLDPLILAVLAMFFFKQKLSGPEWVAFAIVVAGSCIVVA
jgi:drug/metabolite transporter (DMT)-like permease